MTAKRATGSLTPASALNCCLELLVSLTAAPGGTIQAHPFMTDHHLDDEQLDAIIEMLQSIADDRTGARIAVSCANGRISLMGNAGELRPLRLRQPEALALDCALKRCHVNPNTQRRIEEALAPALPVTNPQQLLAADDLFGGFFPTIAEAIASGVRLRMHYRANNEVTATERTIDPIHIEVAGQAAYLVAWNIEKDAQRSYRLDRIARLEMTDESVVPHEIVRMTAAESLAAHGDIARLRWSAMSLFERSTWAGIDRTQAHHDSQGGVTAPVSYTSQTWLFDQVIAGGGEIEIIEPHHLRSALVSYARARYERLDRHSSK